MQHHTALVWFRRDLRLTDNPALCQALAQAQQVVPVYIDAPDEESPWAPGAASRWWLHHALTSLDASLQQLGSRLVIRRGASQEVLRQLVAETGATLICWNRLYEPATIARDKAIKADCRERGITASSHNAALLFEPWTIHNQQGNPFRVFTPYWKQCLTQLPQLPLPDPAPLTLPAVSAALPSVAISALGLLPQRDWDAGLRAQWRVSEPGAAERLLAFIAEAHRYAGERNRPDLQATSCLSPYLHYGQLSPRQILASLNAQQVSAEAFVRELGWREFSHHLLYHFPHTAEQSLDPRFEAFTWSTDPAALRAWQRGRTGIPLVDAGMRELWHTGYMHNRVRMVVASFLTKNLRQHWRHGAEWFWDTLVDASLANNTQGWQWTAGCGADAAPYFRVFNPVLQAEKFDPDGVYLRRWLPELAALPTPWLAQPWQAPAAVLAAAGITLGRDYPNPIVSLSDSRTAALAAYQDLKNASSLLGA